MRTSAATTDGEDDTTDSDNDDEDMTEIGSLSVSLSLAGPPEIPFDPDSSDEETHREHVVTLVQVKGTLGPSREIPGPRQFVLHQRAQPQRVISAPLGVKSQISSQTLERRAR
ncbi:hypothetical protein BJV78DRAFT_1151365 [Lactifluus subvellereus]|nr:hypothetical protein BJV78DRAFT_1151365 [Lactifluus subvellereus]